VKAPPSGGAFSLARGFSPAPRLQLIGTRGSRESIMLDNLRDRLMDGSLLILLAALLVLAAVLD